MSEEEQKTEEQAPDNIQIRDLTEEGASKDKELRFTKRFHMDVMQDDGTKLTGVFTIKRPTIGDQARVGIILADLREDKPVDAIDAGTLQIHEMIAVCKVWVTEAPKWFENIEDSYDIAPLQRVYLEALAFRNSFRAVRVGK